MTKHFVFLIASFLSGSANAGTEPLSAQGLCDLARSLDQIVVAETGMTAMTVCPQIGFGMLSDTGGQRSQAGAYLPASGQIELAPDLDLSTAFGRSFLLHELVHAAQYRSGAEASVICLAELEAEAYLVQAGYLRSHGLREDATMMRVFAGLLGQCPGQGEMGY